MKKRNDILLLAVIIAAALIFIPANKIYKERAKEREDLKDRVTVSIKGKEFGAYDLSKDGEYKIDLENGEYNTVKVENKTVMMKDASCPDKLCIHQGKIGSNGDIIVCLPHGLIVEIKSRESSAVDIVR